jgi:adenylate kinase family enzyme
LDQAGGEIARCNTNNSTKVNVTVPKRIHIFGASGSGTTTLASALSAKHGHRHFDSDDFYWLPTDPPYQQKRTPSDRQTLLAKALAGIDSWVVSGSLCGWSDPFLSRFELVVFLLVPVAERLARLRAREIMRYGNEAIAVGGRLHKTHVEFLNWAQQYDDGGLNIRSRALHEQWIRRLPCNVLRLDGNRAVETLLSEIESTDVKRPPQTG